MKLDSLKKFENKKFIIFDLDDTLLDTSHLYWSVKNDMLELFCNLTGKDKETIDREFEDIEHNNIEIHGYSPERYKFSAVELCQRYKIDDKDIVVCAEKIYLEDPQKIANTDELLSWLQGKFELALLTRGEKDLQIRKLVNNKLNIYFDEKHIKVVPTKDKEVFLNFLEHINVHPTECIVIGDSIKSDINPSIEAGMDVIHYNYRHEHYEWEQDKEDSHHDFVSVDCLLEIKDILEKNFNV